MSDAAEAAIDWGAVDPLNPPPGVRVAADIPAAERVHVYAVVLIYAAAHLTDRRRVSTHVVVASAHLSDAEARDRAAAACAAEWDDAAGWGPMAGCTLTHAHAREAVLYATPVTAFAPAVPA
jgi:hypothetical protein